MIGRTSVECDVYDVSATDAKLMEIDENLERSELDGAQRTQHIKLRETIWKQKHAYIAAAEANTESNGKTLPMTKKVSKRGRKGEGRPEQFAAETAKVAGVTKRAINQELRRAEKLADIIDRLPGTSLDKGVEMDALIKLPKEERAAVVERAVAGEKVSARPITQKPEREKQERETKRDKNPADPNNAPAQPIPLEPPPCKPQSLKDIIAQVADDDAAMEAALIPILATTQHWRGVTGAFHSFTVAQFRAFATAIAQYVDNLAWHS